MKAKELIDFLIANDILDYTGVPCSIFASNKKQMQSLQGARKRVEQTILKGNKGNKRKRSLEQTQTTLE